MPNYVTFKIIETRDGEFVLYLHNHNQKLISEQHRSGDLDEVVDKLKEKLEYRKHFMNALNNFVPVLPGLDLNKEDLIYRAWWVRKALGGSGDTGNGWWLNRCLYGIF
jgi:hypothetical protein